jgi:hypothetical protein
MDGEERLSKEEGPKWLGCGVRRQEGREDTFAYVGVVVRALAQQVLQGEVALVHHYPLECTSKYQYAASPVAQHQYRKVKEEPTLSCKMLCSGSTIDFALKSVTVLEAEGFGFLPNLFFTFCVSKTNRYTSKSVKSPPQSSVKIHQRRKLP